MFPAWRLTRKTASDKMLCDKAFDMAKIPKYDGYQRELASIVYTFFDKKTSATCANKFAGSRIKNEKLSDQKLAQELRKLIIKISTHLL